MTRSAPHYRRAALLAALFRIRAKRQMTEIDRAIVFMICTDLLKGHDARELVGVKPKKGPRPTFAREHDEIAFHCYSLHLRKPGMLLKTACGMVAEHWGIPDRRVTKIANERREYALRAVAMDVDGKRLEGCEWLALRFKANIITTPKAAKQG